MKGKAAKKEDIDVTTLPKANMVVSSIILNFKNQDNKLKLFESFYKGLQNDPLYFFVTREHIIDYARDQKIYEDAVDPKKQNAKDASPVPHKDITPEQLAKSCLGLLMEKSIPCRKDKKVIFDQIEEATKKKEESEKYWNNKLQTQNATETDEKEVKEEKKNKKKEKMKAKKPTSSKEQAPPRPEEIEIPKYDEYTNEMFVILYNYPLSEKEYSCLIDEKNETNDQITINLFKFVNDIDEFIEPKKEEVVLDKKGKPVTKEVKLDKDAAEMQRYFLSTLVLPPHPKDEATLKAEEEAKKKLLEEESKKKEEEDKKTKSSGKKTAKEAPKEEEVIDDGMEPTPLILLDVYNAFIKQKENSDKNSNMRKACFEKEDFSLEGDNKDEIVNNFYKNYLIKLAKIHAQMIYYEEWKKKNEVVKLESEEEKPILFTDEMIKEINSNIDYEKDSVGRNLISFCHELINRKRTEEYNQLIYFMNNFEGMFSKNFDKYRYEFFDSPDQHKQKPNSNKKDNIAGTLDLDRFKTKKQYQNEQQPDSNNNEKNISNNDLAVVLQSHPKLLEEKTNKKIETAAVNCDENSSPFKTIIDYHDLIYKNNLEEKVGGRFIVLIQKKFNLFLSNPFVDKCLYNYYNINRNDLIEQFGRNNEIYSLLTKKGISRYIYDKYYDLNFFENMIKEKVPEHTFDFGDRIYEENYSKELFKQELNKIILYDYECYAKLDERNKKTMLAFFYRCPKGRVYRKQKKYRYLSQPSFQAFVEHFSPEFKLENRTTSAKEKKESAKKESAKKPASDNKTEESNKGYRFTIEEKKENNSIIGKGDLYEADDVKIGEIGEKVKYMFPSDDGVFIKKVLHNGIYKSPISYVRKDNVVFGIKTDNNLNEFWLNFDDGVKVTVTYKSEYNSFFKNSENPVPSNDGCLTTITLEDGLILHIEPNGDIIQKHFKNINNENDNENYRLISSKASVIKYMKNGEININYSSGNTTGIKDNKITNINNKGLKSTKDLSTNDVIEEEPVYYSEHYDPESLSTTIVREDNVKTIKYPDKSKIVIHNDGTKIYTSPVVKEVMHYLIENDNYATIEITYDEVKKRTQTTIAAGSTEALIGSDNLMNRTYDGRLTKINLPDGTLVYVYKEKKSTEEFETYSYNTVTFIYKKDGDVVRITQSGDIVVVTSNERKKLNDNGMNKNFEKMEDIDYLFEVNGKPEERKGGIYTCELNKGKIWTKDQETNIFVQLSNGDSKCKIEGTTITEMNEKTIEQIQPHSPRYEGDDYIDPETRFSDAPKNFFAPRLFVVDNKTLYAKEYLSENQIENFKRTMSKNSKYVYYCTKENKIDGSTVHQWLEKEISNQEKYKNIQNLDNVVKMPHRYIPLSQTIFRFKYPDKEIYIARKLKETGKITKEIKEEIESIDAEFTRTIRNVKKIEISEVDKDVIQMNRMIQRRFIMERLEKKNEERKNQEFNEEKEKSESKLDKTGENNMNVPDSQRNEIKKENNPKENRYLNI